MHVGAAESGIVCAAFLLVAFWIDARSANESRHRRAILSGAALVRSVADDRAYAGSRVAREAGCAKGICRAVHALAVTDFFHVARAARGSANGAAAKHSVVRTTACDPVADLGLVAETHCGATHHACILQAIWRALCAVSVTQLRQVARPSGGPAQSSLLRLLVRRAPRRVARAPLLSIAWSLRRAADVARIVENIFRWALCALSVANLRHIAFARTWSAHLALFRNRVFRTVGAAPRAKLCLVAGSHSGPAHRAISNGIWRTRSIQARARLGWIARACARATNKACKCEGVVGTQGFAPRAVLGHITWTTGEPTERPRRTQVVVGALARYAGAALFFVARACGSAAQNICFHHTVWRTLTTQSVAALVLVTCARGRSANVAECVQSVFWARRIGARAHLRGIT